MDHFLAEITVIGINYLGILQLWLMPQLHEDTKGFILQIDGALLHFSFDVHAHFTANLHGRWSGHASHKDSPLLLWPPWSPDLTSCDFVLMGYIKDCVYVPPPHAT
jgi:hypothetical protein